VTGRLESVVGSNAFLVLLAALVCAFGLIGGDRVQANDGLGWDGVTYALYINKLHDITSHGTAVASVPAPAPTQVTSDAAPHPRADETPGRKHGLNPYYFHRLAPIVAAEAALRAFHLAHSDANIVRVFLWMNTLALLLAAFLWVRILAAVGCRGYARAIGFCALFVNFGNGKMPFYDPVLMDTVSFAMAVVLLYFHVQRRSALLWLATLLGAFIHPWLFYLGAVLFLLPYAPQDPPAQAAGGQATRLGRIVGWALILLLTVLPWIAQAGTFAQWWGARPEIRFLRIPAVVLAGVLVVAYLRVALWKFLALDRLGAIVRKVLTQERAKLVLVVACFVAIEGAIKLLAVGRPAVTPYELLLSNAWRSVVNPLVFAVSHFWFFGPVFVWAVLRWPDVVTAIESLGAGLTLIAVLVILGSIDSESRRVIVLLPFAGLYLAKALALRRYRPPFYALLAGMSLLWSRVWLPLPIDRPWSAPDYSPFAFPWQWFFMNLGPWMIDRVCLVAMGLVVACALVLWKAERHFALAG